MAKTSTVAMRVTDEMKAKLQAFADAERRTLSQYLEIVLEKHVEDRETEQTTEKRPRKR